MPFNAAAPQTQRRIKISRMIPAITPITIPAIAPGLRPPSTALTGGGRRPVDPVATGATNGCVVVTGRVSVVMLVPRTGALKLVGTGAAVR
jgi:hypothetical protein